MLVGIPFLFLILSPIMLFLSKGCLMFVFLSLLEFAIVKYYESVYERHKQQNKERKQMEIMNNYFKTNSNRNQTEVCITSGPSNPLVCHQNYLSLMVMTFYNKLGAWLCAIFEQCSSKTNQFWPRSQ